MDKLKQYIQENLDKLDADSPGEDCWDTISNHLSKENNDPLKDHISRYSPELDIETPAVTAWNRIGDTLSRKPARTISIKKIGAYAAACCLVLMGLGFLLYVNKTGHDLAQGPVIPIKGGNESVAHDTIKGKKAVNEEAIDTIKKELATLSSPKGATLSKRIQRRDDLRQVVKNKPDQLPAEVLQIQKGYNDLIAGQVSYIQHLPIYGENVGYFESFVSDFKKLDMQEKELRKTIAEKGLQENGLDELAMIYQEKLMILKRLQSEINKTSRSRNETDTIPGYIRL